MSRNARCVLVAALLCGMVGCAKEEEGRLGRQMIQLLDLEDRPFDLWQKTGVVTVVLFARSDCPISNRFAPEVRRLCDAYQSKGVEFFLVYVDPRETPEAIRRHLHEYGYACPALRDPGHTLVEHCGATITPEAVVFDRDRDMVYRGRVNDLYAGFGRARTEPTTQDLEDAIASTLAGRSVANPRTKAIGCLIGDLKN